MNRILKSVAVVVLALAAGATGWVYRVSRGPAPATGALTLGGLEAPVEVVRDSFGIPHVWARSQADLWMAQGYLHAQDRLWQMEMFRRVAEGRMSELFGEATLSTDRFLRTLGMHRAARRELEALDSDTRAAVEAYAAGVNAAILGWRGPLPPEFVVLHAKPEPWSAVHSLYLTKVMAWDLTEYSSGLSHARARAALDDDAYALVRVGHAEGGSTILRPGEGDHPAAGTSPPSWVGTPGPGEGGSAPATPPSPQPRSADSVRPSAELLASAAIPPEALPFLEAVSVVRASNSWVVGGALSRSGKPVLANDMHLGLDQPTIWYLMGLHAPGIDIVGMTLPGTPMVVAGHSPAVAWGFTNAALDDADFFLERVSADDTSRYLTPWGSEPFSTRVEEIRVKGREAPELLTVRETRHGPVVTGVEARAGEELMSVRWVGLDVSGTAGALLGMNRARQVEEFVAALSGFGNPHQNVVFADTAGAWGYWMAGTVPLRASGRPPLLPIPGWTGEGDWVGVLPFQEHPHALNPSRGFIATANNRQSLDSVSALITDGTWDLPWRAQRIESLLEEGAPHDAGSLLRIQLDVTPPFVERFRAQAVAHFRAAGREEEARALEEWDGAATLESREATLFWSWRSVLLFRLDRWLYGGEPGFTPGQVLERILDQGHPVADSLGPLAAAEAAETAAGLPWGEAHRLALDHPMAGVPVVGRLFGFGRTGIPREGSPYAVNVAPFGGSRPPFRVGAGPSQRHVVDMADVDASGGFVLPGGQSGFPRSPHAHDQLALWSAGRLIPLPLDRGKVEDRAASRLTLLPAGG